MKHARNVGTELEVQLGDPGHSATAIANLELRMLCPASPEYSHEEVFDFESR